MLTYQKTNLHTKLSMAEVITLLDRNTIGLYPNAFFNFSRDPEGYMFGGATYYDNSFRIRRLQQRNEESKNTLPVIEGKVIEVPSGSEINLEFKISTPAVVFFAFWISVVIVVCVLVLITKIKENEIGDFKSFIPFLMLLSPLLLWHSYKAEYADTKRVLVTLFEAEN